jgi:cytochrome c556
MRALLLLLLGLAVGAIAASFAGNALRERDAYPRAVMDLMQHHVGTLRGAIRARQCDGTTTTGHLQRLQVIATEIGPAFPDVDQPFRDGAAKLENALRVSAAAAPADCPALQAALKPIDDACDSCHRLYR